MKASKRKKTKKPKPPKQQPKVPPIQGLTALRGIAALYVAGFHFHWSLPDGNAFAFPRGYLAVDFFFLLSGFILMHVYGKGFLDHTWHWPSYKKFLTLRLARIYPIHLFTLLLVAAALFFLNSINERHMAGYLQATPFSFVTNLLLINAWHTAPYPAWNSSAWSLSAEWACYLIFPALIAVLKWGKSDARCIALYLSSMLGLALLVAFHHKHSLDVTFDFGFLRAIFEFFQGMLLYRFYQRFGSRFQSQKSLFLAALLCFTFAAAPRATQPFILPAFALLILSVSAGNGVLVSMLEKGPFRTLGDISLSIYLMHRPVMFFFEGFRAMLYGNAYKSFSFAEQSVEFVMFFSLMIFASWLTYKLIELPMRNVIRTRYAKAKPVKY